VKIINNAVEVSDEGLEGFLGQKMNEQICKETRQPIGNLCTRRLQALADRATTVNDRVRSKLMPVVVSMPPGPECGEEVRTGEPFPPLFDSMRASMDVIEAALIGIEVQLDRAEI
jgi:hypothetical protein